jgi:hypothetical protein
MKRKLFYTLGLFILTLMSFVASPSYAQTTANGPYYANPSWDQTLTCTTLATCPRFIVLSNMNSDAVLDRETGLVWEKSPSTTRFSFEDAELHCVDLNVGGRTGWRLPTIQESMSLVDRSVPSPGPTLPSGHPFSNVQSSSLYWSASTFAGNTDAAMAVFFANGFVGGAARSVAVTFVWCVRGGQGVVAQ